MNVNDAHTDKIADLITQRKFVPGGRYLYASGRSLHQTQNCMLLRAEDTREGWGDLTHKATMSLMTGAGIGIDYGLVRASGSLIRRTGGYASGPISLMQIINEAGRHIMQGGARRSAIWAGLPWWHPDVFDFIVIKDWDAAITAAKAEDYNYPATLDMTNISVQLDDAFFAAYHGRGYQAIAYGPNKDILHHEAPDGGSWQAWAHRVYDLAVAHMVKTGEPGFSIDVGENNGESLRNACTEVTSRDDSDVCNLGSINMSRIGSLQEMADAVLYGTLFLLAGTTYSHLPYDKVHEVREKNRRLGLGVMGVHEWLLQRGKPYAPDEELGKYLSVYERSTELAHMWADQYGLSAPVKTRAIAPTGTIGIIAETTTGIEPVFCTAFKRRYKEARTSGGDVTRYQYVIDPTARRIVASGIRPDQIEDAYSLSEDVERRVEFQTWAQQYVDHGISSTINLPAPITDPSEAKRFGRMLMKHLPNMRGITCYPNGARGGQPLSIASYEEAIQQEGVVFVEQEDRCVGGVCGI